MRSLTKLGRRFIPPPLAAPAAVPLPGAQKLGGCSFSEGRFQCAGQCQTLCRRKSRLLCFDEAGKVVYAGSAAASTYTVQKGDSLWAIAEKRLGNGTRYNEIKKLNGLTSDVIYAGQVLKLPNR